MNAPSIFSRILLITGAVAVVGLSYWFIATSLAPVVVPSLPTGRGSVRFDPSADVTKKPHFSEMRLLGPKEIVLTNLGRKNPFVPVPPAPALMIATSTVTSTPGMQLGVVVTSTTSTLP